MTVDEFLGWQATQDRLFELVDGVPVCLSLVPGDLLRSDLQQMTPDLVDGGWIADDCPPEARDKAKAEAAE